MSNPIFQALNGQTPAPLANIQAALSQIKANPGKLLKSRGLNIPDGMNDPQQIINHLLSSGQINNNRLAQVQQMAASRFKPR